METVYIDVYFLINFTVDYIAIYYALRLSRIPVIPLRLIIASILGAAYAVLELFLPYGWLLSLGLGILFLILIVFISSSGVSFASRVKLTVFFLLGQIILGGIVYFSYGFLDKYLYKLLQSTASGAENRRALIFSVIILFAIGALKLLIMILSGNRDEKSVTVKIKIDGKSITTEALVDTGNLVKDPMSMCPVIFIKRGYARRIFPSEVLELERLDSLPNDYKRRIRLIPVTRGGKTHVLTGVRADSVEVSEGKTFSRVDMTIAIDKEDGSFGGYYALVPSLPD